MPATPHQHDPDDGQVCRVQRVTLPPSYTFIGTVDSTGITVTVLDTDGTVLHRAVGDDEAADAIEHVARMVTR